MKNKTLIMLALTMFLLMISFCFAANPKVQIDGKTIDFTDENGTKQMRVMAVAAPENMVRGYLFCR